MKITRLLPVLFLLFLYSHSSAQVVYVLDGSAPGNTFHTSLPSAGYPMGIPGPYPPPPLILPNFQALGVPIPPPAGGHAIDQLTWTVYSTDGVILTADFHPNYAPFVPPPATAAPVISGGPITGMAVDAVGGVLYMCDATSIQSFSNVYPYPPLTSPTVLTFLGAFPLTGLGYEPSTGSLWACDSVGAIYNFTTAGAPIGSQPVAIAPPPIGLGYGGLAVNTTNGPGAFPPWGCSSQVSGFHIVVTDGVNIYDALNPVATPIPVPSGGPAFGLAFSADNQALTPPSFVCPCTGLTPTATISRPLHNGAGVAANVILSNGPPSTPVTLMVDFCPIPGGLPLPAGDILMINPFSPTYRTFRTTTDPFGIAVVPVPMGLTQGLQISVQWYYACSSNAPLGVTFSNALGLTVALP